MCMHHGIISSYYLLIKNCMRFAIWLCTIATVKFSFERSARRVYPETLWPSITDKKNDKKTEVIFQE